MEDRCRRENCMDFRYYAILNMLGSLQVDALGNGKEEAAAEVVRMSQKRNMAFEKNERAYCRDFKYATSPTFVKHILMGLCIKPKMKTNIDDCKSCMAYFIDEEKISEEKARVSDNPSPSASTFVSTNDIISSNYANLALSNPEKKDRSGVLLLTINWRNRIAKELCLVNGEPSEPNESAGNYEGCLFYDKNTWEKPSGIRQSLSAGLPFGNVGAGKLPGFFKRIPTAFISNWCQNNSFKLGEAEDVQLQDLHIPLIPMAPFANPIMDVCIVFNPQYSKTGVLYISKRFDREEVVSGTVGGKYVGSIVGETVSSGMFGG